MRRTSEELSVIVEARLVSVKMSSSSMLSVFLIITIFRFHTLMFIIYSVCLDILKIFIMFYGHIKVYAVIFHIFLHNVLHTSKIVV